MSFKQYRTIDLVLFILIYGICEYGIIKVGVSMVDQPYIVSLILPLMLIVMIRWDKYAIYQAIISAILFVFYQQGDVKQMLVYLLGNLGLMIIAVNLKRIGKEKITGSVSNCIAYVLVGYILLELFRYVGMLIAYHSGVGALVNLLAIDALTTVFSIVVILIVRKIDGVLMDQKQYLLKLQEEKEAEESADEYY